LLVTLLKLLGSASTSFHQNSAALSSTAATFAASVPLSLLQGSSMCEPLDSLQQQQQRRQQHNNKKINNH
jgi:hypothetical protein